MTLRELVFAGFCFLFSCGSVFILKNWIRLQEQRPYERRKRAFWWANETGHLFGSHTHKRSVDNLLYSIYNIYSAYQNKESTFRVFLTFTWALTASLHTPSFYLFSSYIVNFRKIEICLLIDDLMCCQSACK
jgi:hypothetical protein